MKGLLLFALNFYFISVKGDYNKRQDDAGLLRKEFPEQTFAISGDESSDIKVDRPPWSSEKDDQDTLNSPVTAGSSSSEEKPQNAVVLLNDQVDSSDGSFFLSTGAKKKNKLADMDKDEIKQYKAEIKAGDMTRLLGINQHFYEPDYYQISDLGRRFTGEYPLREISQDITEDDEDPSLIPKRAPPELVLAIAKASELIHAAEPEDPNEKILKKESLRTGNYWNTYWKEDVQDPDNILRSPTRSKLDSMTAKLSPGTAIYEYVSKLNKLYPKLLYVINKSK